MGYNDLPTFNYTLTAEQLEEVTLKNKTLNLHLMVTAPNRVFDLKTSVPRFKYLQHIWPTCPLPITWYFN